MLTHCFIHSAMTAGAFSIVAGVAALQFLSDVPKVKKDIVQVREHVQSVFGRPVEEMLLVPKQSTATNLLVGMENSMDTMKSHDSMPKDLMMV